MTWIEGQHLLPLTGVSGSETRKVVLLQDLAGFLTARGPLF